MEYRLDPAVRDDLAVRRRRLEDAIAGPSPMPQLRELLAEVDAALARMDHGAFGLCEICRDPIEDDRLRADPLVHFCLDHLDRREREDLQRDLSLAAQVQGALLPRRDFAAAGWEAHFRFEPVGPVSGDYCDLVAAGVSGDGFLFALGDVAGKGVAASILSAHLSALLRTLHDVGLGVQEMIDRANRLYCESVLDRHYATLVAGRGCSDGTVTLCNAGHLAPVVIRPTTVERVAVRGLPLGMFCASAFPAASVALDPGDHLVLFTDGVTETRDAGGEEFGEARLLEALRLAAGRPAHAMADLLFASLERFRSGAPLADDRALLVLRYVGLS